jgi:hypothetical protein
VALSAAMHCMGVSDATLLAADNEPAASRDAVTAVTAGLAVRSMPGCRCRLAISAAVALATITDTPSPPMFASPAAVLGLPTQPVFTAVLAVLRQLSAAVLLSLLLLLMSSVALQPVMDTGFSTIVAVTPVCERTDLCSS